MSRRLTFLTLAMLPLLPATAGTESDCTAYGWTVYEVTDSQGYPNPYRLALITRLKTSGGRTYPLPVAVTKGLAICPGDKLDTWHGATTTLVRGNNVAGAVAESGSVLHFSDRIVQTAGTVTYLMPSGWGDSIETTLKDGALLVSSIFSTVQVSMSGPSCDPTVEVSVSPLDDPFSGGSATPNPKAHRARLTRLDAEGRPQGPSLELQGDESARITSEAGLPERGGPVSDAAREVFQRSEPRLRAPFAQRGPPTAEEKDVLTLSERRVVVYADTRPVSLRVNGVPWVPWGWFRAGRGDERRWEAARSMQLPPGPSLVEVILSDGRNEAVMTRPSGDIVVDLRVREETPLAPVEPVAEVASAPVVPPPVNGPCGVPLLGGPTGETHTPKIEGLDMPFVGLSAGQFCMGSPDGVGDADEHPQHAVTVAGCLVGKSEVTQAQWRAVVKAAKASKDVDAAGLNEDPSYFKGDKLPVENVSWCDVTRFANALSRLDGRAPVYEISDGMISWVHPDDPLRVPRYEIGDGCTVRWLDGADGYRLPTEAEWEYAARAGTTTAYATGDDEAALALAGWYGAWPADEGGNSGGKTHDVCTAPKQPWGLCDLHGNVWEWVFDTYGRGTYARRAAASTFDGSATLAEAAIGVAAPRVVRGGSWYLGPVNARSADRVAVMPSDSFGYLSFRLLLSSPERP